MRFKSIYMIPVLLLLLVLSACTPNESTEEQTEPEISSTFSIPVLFDNEKKGQYILRGKEGKLGFQIGSGLENEEIALLPIIANESNKYMWYLWGENLSGKTLKVVGKQDETNQESIILDNLVLGTGLNGIDATNCSKFNGIL